MSRRPSSDLAQWLFEGSMASLVSTAVLLWRSFAQSRRAFGALNAPSHWVWDREALARDDADSRHTLLGFAIHHASSLFWALAFRALLRREPHAGAARVAGSAAAVASAAALVDLRVVPERLTPGFERRLSARSLALVYVGFGAGLAAGAWLWPRRQAGKAAGGSGACIRATHHRRRRA